MNAGFYQDLFSNPSLAGVYHLPHGPTDPLIEGAGTAGCLVLPVDLVRARNKSELLDEISAGLRFPEWFGDNWDALADCLMDMAWFPALGYVVILNHCDGIHGLAEEDFVKLLGIFQEASDAWREQGVPFWCLVDLLSDGLAWLPTVMQRDG